MTDTDANVSQPMSENELTPDFSELYAAGLLSDINVIIREEASQDVEDSPKPKRARRSSTAQQAADRIVVPAHRMLLWSLSKFFKAKVRASQDTRYSKQFYTLWLPFNLACLELQGLCERYADMLPHQRV